MNSKTTRIAEGGRVVIPAEYRRELGLNVGDEVVLHLADGELRILSRSEAVRKAQALVRRHVRKGRSLVKELLKERRATGFDWTPPANCHRTYEHGYFSRSWNPLRDFLLPLEVASQNASR